MKIFVCVALLTFITGYLAVPPEINIERHFKQLSEKRHPNFQNGGPWLKARQYISERMHDFGIKNIIKQKFNTTVSDKEVEGVNIIGIQEGSDPNGPVMLVGADYSTSMIGDHLKNNTGGVACLLETVHVFMHNVLWESYYQNNTVLFVAFDLNTREYYGSGMGMPGAHYFVHDWLLPYLKKGKKHSVFRGAVILDSITTYNIQDGSQLLRRGFDTAMPQAAADINENERRGDFIGMFFTSKEAKNPVLTTFYNNYYKERIMLPFRLQKMELSLNFSIITSDSVLSLINHQSHYHFMTQYYHGSPLPAFLLFDTDGDRIDPYPGACHNLKCDVDTFLNNDRIHFMRQTTNSLIRTLLDLQTTYLGGGHSSAIMASPQAVFMAFATLFMALLFSK